LLIPVEQPLQMRLDLPHLLMVHGDLPHDLGAVHLRFEHILLHPLTDLIMSRSVLNELVEDSFVLTQDAEGLLQIGELEIVGLHRIGDARADHSNFRLRRVCVTVGHLSTKAQFPRIRQFLRSSNSDIGEVAVGIPRERFGAAHAELLIGDLRIRQRGHLWDHLPRRACLMVCCGQLWIVRLCFGQKLGQRCGCACSRLLPKGGKRSGEHERGGHKRNHVHTDSNLDCCSGNCKSA
jgi:hypothetical protein